MTKKIEKPIEVQKVFEQVIEPEKLIAKRDFVISQNDFYLEIKKGDDLAESVPPAFYPNLKTENVL